MNNHNVKQVIVIRKDLNMRKGKIAAQAAYKMLPELLKLREENKKLKEEIQGMHEDAAGEDI